MSDRTIIQVRKVTNPNQAALKEMLEQGNGLFLITVHNRRIQKVAKVERGKKIDEIIGYDEVGESQARTVGM